MPRKIPHPLSFGNNPSVPFHRFPVHIWHDYTYSLQERVVLCRVWSFQNSTPPLRCYLSYEQWAKELAVHRVTAINLLNKMVEKGLLEKNRAPEGSNEWSLVVSDYHPSGLSESASSVGLPPLVVSDYPPSSVGLPALVVSDYPRRSLEDQKEDHKEDHVFQPSIFQDDLGTPPEKNEVLKLDSVFKDPLTTETKKPRTPKGPKRTCPAPKEFLTPEVMFKFLEMTLHLKSWKGLSEEERKDFLYLEAGKMAEWSERKNQKRAGWERSFTKWLQRATPSVRPRLTPSEEALHVWNQLVIVQDEQAFRDLCEEFPILSSTLEACQLRASKLCELDAASPLFRNHQFSFTNQYSALKKIGA